MREKSQNSFSKTVGARCRPSTLVQHEAPPLDLIKERINIRHSSVVQRLSSQDITAIGGVDQNAPPAIHIHVRTVPL